VALSAHKKVFVARFDRDSAQGFVQTPGSFTADAVELLTPQGNLQQIPYSEIKVVCFVRDFEPGESWKERRAFATRPKTPGLWVRLNFRDGDTAEGLLPNNLLQVEPHGFFLIPPDPTFQNQRIFVPREALREVQVLGVIGSALRRPKAAKPATTEDGQLEMF
jgi:hypothetical protein